MAKARKKKLDSKAKAAAAKGADLAARCEQLGADLRAAEAKVEEEEAGARSFCESDTEVESKFDSKELDVKIKVCRLCTYLNIWLARILIDTLCP